MNEQEFFSVPLKTRKCKAGNVKLPILYRDGSCLLSLFSARTGLVSECLAMEGLRPVSLIPGRAVVALVVFEYRDTSVGSYNEVAVAVPVVPEGSSGTISGTLDMMRAIARGELGFHILDLPVTTDLACSAGREIWGFPKFVTEIPIQWHGVHFHAEVRDPGADSMIMSLSGRSWPLIKTPAADLTLYSKLRNQPLRTAINMKNGLQWNLNTDVTLSVGNSTHAMAERLRLLELDGKQPFAIFSSWQFQSRLNAGERMSVDEAAEVP